MEKIARKNPVYEYKLPKKTIKIFNFSTIFGLYIKVLVYKICSVLVSKEKFYKKKSAPYRS